jgi:hypothetical protein
MFPMAQPELKSNHSGLFIRHRQNIPQFDQLSHGGFAMAQFRLIPRNLQWGASFFPCKIIIELTYFN